MQKSLAALLLILATATTPTAATPGPASPFGTDLQVCTSIDAVCLNETVVQRCWYDLMDPSKFIPFGNPVACDNEEVCDPDAIKANPSSDGCVPVPPFECKGTGTFAGKPGCNKYHKCTVTSSYTKLVTYTCASNKVFSCKYKTCVYPYQAPEGCLMCRQ